MKETVKQTLLETTVRKEIFIELHTKQSNGSYLSYFSSYLSMYLLYQKFWCWPENIKLWSEEKVLVLNQTNGWDDRVTPMLDNSCLNQLNPCGNEKTVITLVYWKGKWWIFKCKQCKRLSRAGDRSKFYEGQKSTLVWKYGVLSILPLSFPTSLLTFIPDFLTWEEAMSVGPF